MKIERTTFLALATSLAAACGPAPATPAAAPTTNAAQSSATPEPNAPAPDSPAGDVPGAGQPDQPGSTAPDKAVAGEAECDRLVPAPCSESSAPRERCKNELRRLASDSPPAAAQSFIACIRSSAASLPAADAACAQSRARCEQLSKACDGPRQALDQCNQQADGVCQNPAEVQAGMACADKCMKSIRMDGCAPAQCAALGEKLQACVQKCGNPMQGYETCKAKRCETAQQRLDACREQSAGCTIPDRCHSVDLPACQAGHAVIEKCIPK